MVLSIQEGKISSVTLLRRLSTYSRRNNFYKAFRERPGPPSHSTPASASSWPPRPDDIRAQCGITERRSGASYSGAS